MGSASTCGAACQADDSCFTYEWSTTGGSCSLFHAALSSGAFTEDKGCGHYFYHRDCASSATQSTSTVKSTSTSKSSSTAQPTSTSKTSSTVQATSTTKASPSQTVICEVEGNFGPNPIATPFVTTLAACGAACSSSSSCLTYEWISTSTTCHLYSAALSSTTFTEKADCHQYFYQKECYASTTSSVKATSSSTQSSSSTKATSSSIKATTTTAASSTTVKATSTAQPSSTTMCNAEGNFSQKSYNAVYASSAAVCGAACMKDSNCMTYEWVSGGSNTCNFYTAALSSSTFTAKEACGQYFYQRSCAVSATTISSTTVKPTTTLLTSTKTTSTSVKATATSVCQAVGGFQTTSPTAYSTESRSSFADCQSACDSKSSCNSCSFKPSNSGNLKSSGTCSYYGASLSAAGFKATATNVANTAIAELFSDKSCACTL
ncbi:hypothetical protein BX600DRAFT_466809 [Xylariales sp. PMI_506]|nr:hypothetical protein BX600DRAFT_466809 [Xylariales sp. PMI_506]